SRYVAAPDRSAGKDFRSRLHFFDIALVKDRLDAKLLETVLLRDSSGQPFVSGMTQTKTGMPRHLDIEGIRAGARGSIFVADEYGPFVYEFDTQGRQLRSLEVPRRFRVARPDPDPVKELQLNTEGRVPNRGMEGLAVAPDGRKLYGMMQSPLLQDG